MGACVRERSRQHAAVIGREVEIVHCAGDVEIGIGIEALDEGAALMVEIALHLKIMPEPIGDSIAALQRAPEFLLERRFGQIAHVSHHTRHRQALRRLNAFLLIIPTAPIRIRHDRLPADFMQRNVLRCMPR